MSEDTNQPNNINDEFVPCICTIRKCDKDSKSASIDYVEIDKRFDRDDLFAVRSCSFCGGVGFVSKKKCARVRNKTISGYNLKLKNRRVRVAYNGNKFALTFKKLTVVDDERLVQRTVLTLSPEGAVALLRLLSIMILDCDCAPCDMTPHMRAMSGIPEFKIGLKVNYKEARDYIAQHVMDDALKVLQQQHDKELVAAIDALGNQIDPSSSGD